MVRERDKKNSKKIDTKTVVLYCLTLQQEKQNEENKKKKTKKKTENRSKSRRKKIKEQGLMQQYQHLAIIYTLCDTHKYILKAYMSVS